MLPVAVFPTRGGRAAGLVPLASLGMRTSAILASGLFDRLGAIGYRRRVTTRLLLVSDTHIPGRARRLPEAVLRAADAADLIVHAGDWVAEAVLDELAGHGDVLGVFGNNDDEALRARLPEVARRTVEGVRVAVVHETGDAKTRDRRMPPAYPEVDVLVFGHSHIPWDSTAAGGLRLLNPGSPTDRRRQPHKTFMTAVVDDGVVVDIRLVVVE